MIFYKLLWLMVFGHLGIIMTCWLFGFNITGSDPYDFAVSTFGTGLVGAAVVTLGATAIKFKILDFSSAGIQGIFVLMSGVMMFASLPFYTNMASYIGMSLPVGALLFIISIVFPIFALLELQSGVRMS